jgi:uncharacterized protein YecT (DUF1311 family)
MRLAAALAATLTFAALPATAQNQTEVQKRYSAEFNACMDGPDIGSNASMLACLNPELERQDAALNRRYQQVMATLTASQKAKLRTAQRAWIAYRDAWCLAQEDFDWGTMSRIDQAYCELDETIERTIGLETYRQQ